MRGNPLENTRKRAGFDWVMVGDDFVVLAVALRGQANMRTALTSRFVTQHSQSLNQIWSVYVARQFHLE